MRFAWSPTRLLLFCSSWWWLLWLATAAVPDNDLCSNPLLLTPILSSSDASAATTTLVVGTTLEATAESLACASSVGPTVWYSVVGTGARFRATTCTPESTFEATLVVTNNNCDNGSTCLVYDWGDTTCFDGTKGATVEWFTTSGTTYHLAVTGYGATDTGTFGLQVIEDVRPDNDDCATALEVVPTFQDTTVVGSTANANLEALACASTTGGTVWYSMMGTGARFRASTCTPETTFDATLVLTNRDCDNAGEVCLDYAWGDSNGCEEEGIIGAQLEWFTENGTEYWVAVAGYSSSDAGAFGLSVLEYVLPENDSCGSAEDVSSGGLFLGSTANATLEDLACSSSTGPTVWYSLVGTGARFRVSTCTRETNFDTTVVVSQRDCDSVGATCVGYVWGDANQCGDGNVGATLEFFTDPDVVYKVAVAGYSSREVGSFGLEVLEYILPPNDRCSGATNLEASSDGGSVFVLGNTANATLETLECSYAGEVPMIWYSIVGTGSRMRASTCSMDTLGPTTIVVSERECDTVGVSCISTTAVECSDSNLGSVVEWDSTEGTTYKISVATTEDPSFSLQIGPATEDFDDAVNESSLNEENIPSAGLKTLNLGVFAVAILVLIV